MRLTQRIVLHTVLVSALVVAVLFIAVARAGLAGNARGEFLLLGVGAIAAGAALSWWLARGISTPIDELRTVAKALADGDLSRRPSLTGTGEVGEFGDSLRKLADELDARRKSLRAEEELLVALTESLNEGVVAVDARLQVVRINETARQLLRLREPVPFPADYLPRDRTLREALNAVLSQTEAVPGEVRVDDRTLSLTARPLPAGGAVLALYDLTPFRRLEAVRRDFVANVSHELRTPLTVITGFVETLQDDDLPPDLRRKFLGMAEGNVRRMQRIVDDLLDLSRIESGGWLPNPIAQDMTALAAEVLAPLQAAAQAKGVALRVEVPPDTSLYGDPTAARQILSNLAENALRHTMTGEVVLFAEPHDDGTWIGVRDTGVGMEAEHLPRIFERFYRADPGRSREAGGTGLGLAIVRHLAEAHGGRVRAESTPGVGTTIAALFPSGREDPPA